MVNPKGLEYLKRFNKIPTASFYEQWVHKEIKQLFEEKFLNNPKVELGEDSYGDLYFHYKGDSNRDKPKSIAYVVHTDHPAFHLTKLAGGTYMARMMGGLRKEYMEGLEIELYNSKDTPENKGKGKIIQALDLDVQNPAKRYLVEVLEGDGDYNFANLALDNNVVVENDMIRAKVLDDYAGIAMSLVAFEETVKREDNVDLWLVFHRAEEVALLGAYLFAEQEIMPKDTFVLSIETSSYRTEVNGKKIDTCEVGKGIILRTGDKRTPNYELSCLVLLHNVALEFNGDLQERLMGAGTCEASVYYSFGYRAAGICVPVIGWHNDCYWKNETGVMLEETHVNDFNTGIDFMSQITAYLGKNPLLYKSLGDVQKTDLHVELLKDLQYRAKTYLENNSFDWK